MASSSLILLAVVLLVSGTASTSADSLQIMVSVDNKTIELSSKVTFALGEKVTLYCIKHGYINEIQTLSWWEGENGLNSSLKNYSSYIVATLDLFSVQESRTLECRVDGNKETKVVKLSVENAFHNAVKKFKVLSSLQNNVVSSNTLLAPYPVGMELGLMCLTLGYQAYWYESTANSGPQKLETSTVVFMCSPDIVVNTYRIPSLSSSDDGRQLMCIRDGSTLEEEVTLDVVDKPHIIVERSGPNLRCSASYLHSRLQLCWFKNRSKSPVKCSTGNILEVDLSELPMHQISRRYVCKAQLRSEDERVLEQEVLNNFTQIFEETSKTLQVNTSEVDPSKCDAKHHDKGDTHGSVLYVEQTNFDTCRKVVITEKTEPKAAARTTTKPPPPSSTPTTTYETTSVCSNMKQTELATFAVAFMVYVMTGYLSRLVL